MGIAIRVRAQRIDTAIRAQLYPVTKGISTARVIVMVKSLSKTIKILI
jgi:hypothetical protein